MLEKEVVKTIRALFNIFIKQLFDDEQFQKLWMVASFEKVQFGEVRQETKDQINNRMREIVQATGNTVQRTGTEETQTDSEELVLQGAPGIVPRNT